MISIMLRYAIGAVWLIAGLWCKVLNGVPRHQQIVGRILGERHVGFFTKAIGLAEIGMAIWVWSGYQVKVCAVVQMVTIMVMNTIELIYTKDLLLFGRINFVIAMFFSAIIGWSSFITH